MTAAVVTMTAINLGLSILAAWQRHQSIAPVLRKRAKARRKARKAQTA